MMIMQRLLCVCVGSVAYVVLDDIADDVVVGGVEVADDTVYDDGVVAVDDADILVVVVLTMAIRNLHSKIISSWWLRILSSLLMLVKFCDVGGVRNTRYDFPPLLLFVLYKCRAFFRC